MLAGPGGRLGHIRDRSIAARHDRHAGGNGDLPGGDFVAHCPDCGGGRTDEDDASLATRFGERSVLGKEAITGVEGFGARPLGDGDDGIAIEVREAGTGRNAIGIIGHADMGGLLVTIAVDGHGRYAEFPACPDDPDGNLAPICHKHTPKHHSHPREPRTLPHRRMIRDRRLR